MLQDERSDPHIVRWNRRALLTQLAVNGGVMMRGLLIGIEHADTGLQKKNAVGRLRCAVPGSPQQIRFAILPAR